MQATISSKFQIVPAVVLYEVYKVLKREIGDEKGVRSLQTGGDLQGIHRMFKADAAVSVSQFGNIRPNLGWIHASQHLQRQNTVRKAYLPIVVEVEC